MSHPVLRLPVLMLALCASVFCKAVSAQTVADSLAQVTAADSTAVLQAQADSVMAAKRAERMARRALLRSWRGLYPFRQPADSALQYADSLSPKLKGRQLTFERAAQHERQRYVDSIMAQVRCIPFDPQSMRYQHNLRLHPMHTGRVPQWDMPTVTDAVAQRMRGDVMPWNEAFLPQDSAGLIFRQQNDCDRMMRHAIFQGLRHNPAGWRYARRKFDVPGADRRGIRNQHQSLTRNRVTAVEELLLNLDVTQVETSLNARADKWHWRGQHILQMSQTALSDNWYKGGENNMTINSDQKISISRYDAQKKTTFEMIFDLKLSGYYTKADTLHPMKVSDNLFSMDLKYGYKAWKRWYYSMALYAKTPIFDYYKSNDRTVRSTFLSPLEVNLSVGMDYKYQSPHKAFTYSLMLAPLSYNMKYVRDPRVQVTNYGIDADRQTLHQYGSTVTSKFDWKMGRVATWSSRLYYFTSYDSQVVEFENTLDFTISRYFSARVYYYPRFDDNTDTRVETKEMLTFGFSYRW